MCGGESEMFIAVVGSGHCSPDVATLAEAVGRELARRGAVLVCGGLGGVMEAACRGAKSEGGLTIGILPGNSRREANPYVDVPIVTGMGEARNVLVVQSAQAVIAIHGEYGTLSELAHALKLGIPVVGLHTWRLYKEGQQRTDIARAQTATEAVEQALALAVN
jgi:uncharacterized protein (TIGR00725 family)